MWKKLLAFLWRNREQVASVSVVAVKKIQENKDK